MSAVEGWVVDPEDRGQEPSLRGESAGIDVGWRSSRLAIGRSRKPASACSHNVIIRTD
jgi:hypothetical protein